MSHLNKIVVANLALTLTHQVDAAYWHEWEMFRLPGGIQFFDAVNAVLFVGALACLVAIAQRRPSGFACSLVLAAACGCILPIHAAFALAGYDQFGLPFSVFLIVATFALSILQFRATLRARREFEANLRARPD